MQEDEASEVALRLVQDVRIGRVALLEQELAPDDVLARFDVQRVGPDERKAALVRIVQVEDVPAVDADRGDGGVGPVLRVAVTGLAARQRPGGCESQEGGHQNRQGGRWTDPRSRPHSNNAGVSPMQSSCRQLIAAATADYGDAKK